MSLLTSTVYGIHVTISISHCQIIPVILTSFSVTMADVNLNSTSVITMMTVETTVMRRDVVSSC